MIYSPTAHGQGSWVSLATDDKGRLIASDQYGRIYRVTVNEDEVEVDSIELAVGSAQGLLWTNNGLYVSVNARPDSLNPGSGLYRLTDSDNDDSLDKIEKLISLEGEGEHGPHSIIQGPDGKSLYLIAGNHTRVPESFTSVLNGNWENDQLFPAILDPRGHANDILPPGGWIARSDDQGATWKVIASGFRNAYDIAFNYLGDLFTYDSDMEWDLGTPWYRPTRICHVIPGAEFGWRTGSGKWPAYYPDNLPGILDIGQGSPTGIVFGKGARFPGEYQKSLFIADWSFGTIYQVDLTPQGASYQATKTEFMSGTPLAITDLIIGKDGNMYFATGGRRGTSYLYQVKYTGDKPVSPVQQNFVINEEQQIVRTLVEPAVSLNFVWQSLSLDDRFIRYTARVALEKKPVNTWLDNLENETNTLAIIQASIAALRSGATESYPVVLNKLNTISVNQLALEHQLDLVRSYGLYLIRTGQKPKSILTKLPGFPTGNPALDREVLSLRVALDDPSVIDPALSLMEMAEESIEADLTPVEVLERSEQYGPTIEAMHANRPAEQGLAMAKSLSHLTSGWTNDQRDRYFRWFYSALQKSGGMSYTGFVERIRLQALDNVPVDERERLAEVSGESLLNKPAYDPTIAPPEGPGRNWVISEARRVVNQDDYSPDLIRGEELYKGLLCASCHAINGQGGNIGPDLTQAGTRFSDYDLLMSMISPSVSISDQYGATLYTLTNGRTLVGRTLRTTEDSVFISINPFVNSETPLAKSDIKSEETSPISLMPGGLINALNEDELRDLIAYLKAEK